MTEKADKIVRDALGELLVQAVEAPVQPDQAQVAIRYMNRIANSLSAMGINLGYTNISSLGDDVTIPDSTIDGFILLLAVRLAPQYDVPTSVDLRLLKREGMESIRAATFSIGATEYGDTLPIGSGNETEGGFDLDHFYPDLQDNILTETTGSIGLESETAENT